MGESSAAIVLANAIAKHSYHIILSATTLSGYERLAKNAPENSDVLLQPIDHPLCIGRAIKAAAPKALVILENDLWLGMLFAAKKQGAKIFIASGKFSKHTRTMSKIFPFYYRAIWKTIDRILAKSPEDAKRFVAAGTDAKKTESFVDLKLTPHFSMKNVPQKPNSFPIIIAGSIRSSEEELVIEAISNIFHEFEDTLVVFAPRHKERFDAVAVALKKAKIGFVLKSKGEYFSKDTPVLILDTLGELQSYYAIGDVSIIGGTFGQYGGHNPIESVYRGCPVIHGPNIDNNRKLFQTIDNAGAGVSVLPEKLSHELKAIIGNNEKLENMRKACDKLAMNTKNLGSVCAKRIIEAMK